MGHFQPHRRTFNGIGVKTHPIGHRVALWPLFGTDEPGVPTDGDKRRQRRDFRQARDYWHDYLEKQRNAGDRP